MKNAVDMFYENGGSIVVYPPANHVNRENDFNHMMHVDEYGITISSMVEDNNGKRWPFVWRQA